MTAISMSMVFSPMLFVDVISVETVTVSTNFLKRQFLCDRVAHPGDDRLCRRRRVTAEELFFRKVDFLQG